MKRFYLSFLLFALFAAAIFPSTRQLATPVLAIIRVTVIDATGAESAPDQTVVIKGDGISSLLEGPPRLSYRKAQVQSTLPVCNWQFLRLMRRRSMRCCAP
jgi:hypothetical protein